MIVKKPPKVTELIFQVITFGCNDEGALGRVTPDDEAEFTPAVVNLPDKAVQISAGDSHTAVLLSSGKVFAWGTFRVSGFYFTILFNTRNISGPLVVNRKSCYIMRRNLFICLC